MQVYEFPWFEQDYLTYAVQKQTRETNYFHPIKKIQVLDFPPNDVIFPIVYFLL